MRISDWSSDVCSSDLSYANGPSGRRGRRGRDRRQRGRGRRKDGPSTSPGRTVEGISHPPNPFVLSLSKHRSFLQDDSLRSAPSHRYAPPAHPSRVKPRHTTPPRTPPHHPTRRAAPHPPPP